MRHQRKIIIDSVQYDSIKSASINLNISVSTIFDRLNSVRFINYNYLDEDEKQDNKRVIIDGICFPNVNYASRFTGIPAQRILLHVNSSLRPEWRFQ